MATAARCILLVERQGAARKVGGHGRHPFPPALGPGTFDVTVLDNNGNPSTVLDAATDIFIDTTWTLDSVTAGLLGGSFDVTAYAESIGPGFENVISQENVPVNGGTSYTKQLRVPANTLPNNPGPPVTSVYRVAVILTHNNGFGANSELAAFVETVLQIA